MINVVTFVIKGTHGATPERTLEHPKVGRMSYQNLGSTRDGLKSMVMSAMTTFSNSLVPQLPRH
jgi:hypothetical protein